MDTNLLLFSPPLLALFSSFFFASASFVFRKYSLIHGVLWMNAFKTLIAFICFSLLVFFQNKFEPFPRIEVVILLAVSGVLGLILGDLLLLSSYRKIGSGRTLMLASFNPLFLAMAGSVLFGDVLTIHHWLAVVFLCMCVVMLGLEDFKLRNRVAFSGFTLAVGATALDACGMLVTRFAFQVDPELNFQIANLIRLSSAGVGFVLINFFARDLKLFPRFRQLSGGGRGAVIFASFLGTFVALSLWILALKNGKIGVISAMSGFAPLYATTIECVLNRKLPSKFLVAAGICFLIGFRLIISTL